MKRPWMPLYVGDYLADTAHLNALESGGYLHLIMHYWLKGGLPDDDHLLARIAKMTPEEWERSRDIIRTFFSDGWKHKRVEFEMTEAARLSAAGKAGGVASGAARRVKGKKRTTVERPLNDSVNDQPTIREALHSQSQKIDAPNGASTLSQDSISSSAISSETKKERVGVARARARLRASRLPDDWTLCDADRGFAATLLPPQRIDFERDKFRDYWHARAGPGAVKVDWSLTWKNWIRREATRGRETEIVRNGFVGPISQEPHRSQYASRNEKRWAEAFETVEQDIRARSNGAGDGGKTGAPIAGRLAKPSVGS